MSNTKQLTIISGVVLLIWIVVAIYLNSRISTLESELLKEKETISTYEALSAMWSQKAKKEALRRMETVLRIYGIKPEIKKTRGKKLYIFTLDATRADKVLGKILNSNIPISHFSAKRLTSNTLEVKVEVAP